jgi:hypothetical protein
LILAYRGLEKENLDQKLDGPPGWGLVQQASSLLIEKKKLLKSPLEIGGHQGEGNEADPNLPGRRRLEE